MTHSFKPGLSRCLKLIRAVVKVSRWSAEHESGWHVKISAVIERAECVLPRAVPGEAVPRPTNLFVGTSDFEGLVTTKPPIRLIPN